SGGARMCGFNFELRAHPAETRHANVENKTAGARRIRHSVKKLTCRDEWLHLITGGLDQPRQGAPYGGVVVDEKDGEGGGHGCRESRVYQFPSTLNPRPSLQLTHVQSRES